MTDVPSHQQPEAGSNAPTPAHDVERWQQRRRLPIGSILRQLRGNRSLREVQHGSGVNDSYLICIEHGTKQPGFPIIERMAHYYGISASNLIRRAEVLRDRGETYLRSQDTDIERSYRYLLDDPQLESYEKPTSPPPLETKRFIVKLYERYTGRQLMSDEA